MTTEQPVFYTERGEPVYGDTCALCGCDYAGPDHTPCLQCREMLDHVYKRKVAAQKRWDRWPRLHKLFGIPRPPTVPWSSRWRF